MIELLRFPVCGVVAFDAGCGESGAGVVVVVVGLMARDAVLIAGRRRLEEHGEVGHAVAGFTLELLVRSEQVEAVGGDEVIELGLCPRRGIVAFEAGSGESGAGVVVVVVGLMAGDAVLIAGRRRLEEHGEVGHAVAGFTLELLVRSEQVEAVGGDEVIELGLCPRRGIVAFEAGSGKTGAGVVVIVIGLMTGDAVLVAGRRRLEEHGEIGHAVAGLALELFVRAEQIEAVGGEDMVELIRFPRRGIVAFEACCGKTGAGVIVVVVELMAGEAVLIVSR